MKNFLVTLVCAVPALALIWWMGHIIFVEAAAYP